MQRVVYAKSAWIMVWRHWFGWLNWLGIHVKQSVRFRHITATRDLYCICIAVRDDMLYFAIASLHRHISSLPSTYNLLHTSSFLSFSLVCRLAERIQRGRVATLLGISGLSQLHGATPSAVLSCTILSCLHWPKRLMSTVLCALLCPTLPHPTLT